MADLFSDEWMDALKNEWNNEPGVCQALADIGFDSVITYGFKDDKDPVAVFVVEKGICVRAGAYAGETADWDMRADRANWIKWASKGIGMTGLGLAYAAGKLKFFSGDYAAMMKNPKMAGPFI